MAHSWAEAHPCAAQKAVAPQANLLSKSLSLSFCLFLDIFSPFSPSQSHSLFIFWEVALSLASLSVHFCSISPFSYVPRMKMLLLAISLFCHCPCQKGNQFFFIPQILFLISIFVSFLIKNMQKSLEQVKITWKSKLLEVIRLALGEYILTQVYLSHPTGIRYLF